MLLFCVNGQVIATHDYTQNVAPSLYGVGVQVIPVPNGTVLVPVNGVRGPPWIMPTPTIQLLLDYASFKRWLTAIAGTTSGTTVLLTDDASQSKMAGCQQAFDKGLMTSVEFKAASAWVTCNAAQFLTLYEAVVAHLQACYAAEASVAMSIGAGTVTTFTQVDAAFAAIT
jgi:hypothetical protein